MKSIVTKYDPLVEYNAYYPYGMLMSGSGASTSNFVTSPTGSVQPYKYTGKELDRENGLDTYDFEARCYDPALATTWQQDPLADKYTQLSPYLWCAANPIRNTDPSGMEPVYNMKGEFIGNTIEGFVKDIYVLTGSSKPLDISNLTISELESLAPICKLDELLKTVDNIPIIDEAALSNIFTDIISRQEGNTFNGSIFSMKGIKDERIAVDFNLTSDFGKKSSWQTILLSRPISITGSGDYEYESTVENITVSVVAHEWYAHGVKHIHGRRNHYKAYQAAKMHPMWEKTTELYRKIYEKRMSLDYWK